MASIDIDKLTSAIEIEPDAESPKNVAGVFFVTEDGGLCKDTGKCRIFHCSKCGYGIGDIFLNDEDNYPITPKYCPNCGCKVSGTIAKI